MKLFVVHCGFYDPRVQSGLFEGHTNIYVAAASGPEARAKVKARPDFRQLKMHIDGLQEILAIDGHDVVLRANPERQGKTVVRNQKLGSRVAVEVEL